MKGLNVGIIGLLVTGLTAGAYFLGANNSAQPVPEISGEPKNLEEIAKLDSEFNRQQAEFGNRLTEVQNRIETVKLNLDENDTQVQSTEIADRLEEMNERFLATTATDTSADVPFPPDSPAGKLRNQARTESGIPVSVLRNYEKETGVSPDEVEELMRRTK